MTPDQEWRGDSRLTERPPRAIGGGASGTARAPVPIGSTLDSLHKISKASHYETHTNKRPYCTSGPRLEGARLRPREFLCRPHLCRIRRDRFIADAVRANSRAGIAVRVIHHALDVGFHCGTKLFGACRSRAGDEHRGFPRSSGRGRLVTKEPYVILG
jgi:hypothetical protein